jgi:Domain of unknown function (DUF4350)
MTQGFSQKIRNPWIAVPAVFAVLFTLGAVWFFHTYERKAFEEFRGGSPAAWKNPWLAAQRYLEAMGKDTVAYHGISHLTSLPPPDGALFIRRLPKGISKSVSDSLFAWAHSGGHLILTPGSWELNKPESGSILARLGVSVQKNTKDCGCPPKTGQAAKKTQGKKNPKKTVGGQMKVKKTTDDGYHPYDSIIDLNLDGRLLHLKYFESVLLTDSKKKAVFRINGSYRIVYTKKADKTRENNNTIQSQTGDWLLQYRVGAGKITVLSDNTLFTNQQIGDFDHAFFLSWLLKDEKSVRLLYSSEATGLATIVWSKMPFFWVSFLVMLILVIWRLQKRSGSLLRPGANEQLNILDHIDASGMFGWRMNKARTMIAANRKAVLQRLAQRKKEEEQDRAISNLSAANLAAKTGLSEKQVFDAFRLRVDSEQDLIRTSRALQKIHRRLQGGELTRHDG